MNRLTGNGVYVYTVIEKKQKVKILTMEIPWKKELASELEPIPTSAEVKGFEIWYGIDSLMIIQGQGTVIDAEAINDYGIDRKIDWKSSDTGTVSINEEKGIGTIINGCKKGTATVTATDQFGNEVVLTVTVIKVELLSEDVTLKVGETLQLDVKISAPDKKKVSYGWFTDDSSIASISDTGLITATGKGRVNLGVEIPGAGKDWIAVTVE